MALDADAHVHTLAVRDALALQESPDDRKDEPTLKSRAALAWYAASLLNIQRNECVLHGLHGLMLSISSSRSLVSTEQPQGLSFSVPASLVKTLHC